MPDAATLDTPADQWRRLSPWSVVELSVRAIARHIRYAYLLAPATFGIAQSDFFEYAWLVPAVAAVIVVVGSCLSYIFYAYRVREDSVQVRQGALHRKHLDLAFERTQNISIEQAVYYRPLDLVTLKIDGAGSAGEEVLVIAIRRSEAEAARAFIRARKGAAATSSGDEAEAADGNGELFFERSLADLVVHGLTNNRAFLAVAGAFGLLSQANVSPAEVAARLGIDFDVVIAGMSMVRLTMLLVMSFILAGGLIALLSVLVSIFVYYGFELYRGDRNLLVKRGLLTRHEIHVEKSRIQSIALRQDWLDHLLGRRNVLLESISHARPRGDESGIGINQRILVPSVRLHETATVTDEILPIRVEGLTFTPARKRYFHKHAAIFSCLYGAALAACLLLSAPLWTAAVVVALWPGHIALAYMTWRRKGLAVDGEHIVARGGTIGIDYTIFPAYKVQDVTHVQSIFMKRRHLSTLIFHTASTTARVPYLDTAFARSVVDYCLYSVEARERPWM
jgi:putative membrane protein